MIEITEDLMWDDPEGYKTVQQSRVTYQGRWSVGMRRVVQCQTTGRFYGIYWTEGSTERQDHEDHDIQVQEVFPYATVDYDTVKR